jgi:drug/metabolite transporter (DMT)-like permease
MAILAAALAHASWNVLVRSGHDRLMGAIRVAVAAALWALPAVVLLPLPAVASWPYLVASAIIHLAYFLLVGMAYTAAGVGVAYPVSRGLAPVLTAAGAALFLGERLPAAGLAGVAALASGILLLALEAGRHGGRLSVLRPALANAVVIALYTLVDGTGVRAAGNAASYVCWLVLLTGCIVLGAAPLVRPGRSRSTWLAVPWSPVVGGALLVASYGVALWAMTRAPIALVAALRETSVLFATGLAALFLRERFGTARVTAATLVVVGIVALKIG